MATEKEDNAAVNNGGEGPHRMQKVQFYSVNDFNNEISNLTPLQDLFQEHVL